MRGMARKPRNEVGAGVYHVYARGNNRESIFRDVEDRQDYLLRLRLVIKEAGWRLLAYALMGNHLHLVIETVKPNLGDGMRKLHGGFAQSFNRRHGRSGHLFGDRFGSVVIESDEQFQTVVRYVVCNPVKAGLVPTPSRWPWSSASKILPRGMRAAIDWRRLLGFFGPIGAVVNYRRFIGDPEIPP